MILNNPRIQLGLRLAWGAALLSLVALFGYSRSLHKSIAETNTNPIHCHDCFTR